MAERIEPFTCLIPAGTAIAAPLTTLLAFDPGIVTRMEIRIPPGPSGLVGFMIAHNGQPVIPYKGGTWIIADDERLDWSLHNFPVGGGWQLRAYNTDVYPHTLYIRLHIDEIPTAPEPLPQIITIE